MLGIVAFDAAGALVAAVMMAAGSIVPMSQVRSLITGRALPAGDVARLRAAIVAMPEVHAVNRLSAIYSGVAEVLVDVDLDLAEDLGTTEIEAALDDLERRAREAIPEVTTVRVLLNSVQSPTPPARSAPG